MVVEATNSNVIGEREYSRSPFGYRTSAKQASVIDAGDEQAYLLWGLGTGVFVCQSALLLSCYLYIAILTAMLYSLL